MDYSTVILTISLLFLSHLIHFYRAIPIPTAAARVARAAPPREAREVTHTHMDTAAERVGRDLRERVERDRREVTHMDTVVIR